MQPEIHNEPSFHHQLNPRLPEDVLFYTILVRLSTRTLVCFRSVCKAWNLVTRDPQFVRKHLDPQHHRLLGSLSYDGVYSVVYENAVGVEWFSLPAISSYKPPQLLGSCNGLAGISIHHDTFLERKLLYLCNPSTRESKLIPEPDPYIDSDEPLGFAYDSDNDDYKFVRVINTDKTCRMDMYSLRNNSWKNIKNAPPHDSEFKHFQGDQYPVVGVNGYIYRMGFEGSDDGRVTVGLYVFKRLS